MPIYNYECGRCGPFEAWAPVMDASSPSPCPECGKTGLRQLAVPHLALMSPVLRKAMGRSEKSSTQPQVVNKAHLAGCGCALCKVRPQPNSVRKRWMIGH